MRRHRLKTAILSAFGLILFLVVLGIPAPGSGDKIHPILVTQEVRSVESNAQAGLWNGRKGAISLTFDDGDPSHLSIAIPELDKRGLKGTFFLTANNIPGWSENDKLLWRQAVSNGHELGDHSVNHPHPDRLPVKQLKAETLDAKKTIEKTFGTKVISYAYPFGEITPELKSIVRKNFIASRGGYGDSYYLYADRAPDWADIPSQVTLTRLGLETYTNWALTAIEKEGWTVLMIHGIEGTPWGWEPVPLKIFQSFLDFLQSKTNELWVAPFGEVAGYLKNKLK